MNIDSAFNSEFYTTPKLFMLHDGNFALSEVSTVYHYFMNTADSPQELTRLNSFVRNNTLDLT